MGRHTLKYITVEDNEVDQMLLQVMAGTYPQLQHCGSFTNALDGWNALKHIRPDLIFLDIEMPGCSGIDLLRKVKDSVPVTIFITSHPEYALEGFELAAFDYILKPLEEPRFAQTMSRLQEYWDMKAKAREYTIQFEQELISIRQGYDQIRIPLNDMVYLEAMGDYTKLVTISSKYMILATLSAFIQQLPPERFTRIHRSYAVAHHKVERIGSDELGIGTKTLPIGKTYRKTVKEQMGL